jgi:hypothetical protein
MCVRVSTVYLLFALPILSLILNNMGSSGGKALFAKSKMLALSN